MRVVSEIWRYIIHPNGRAIGHAILAAIYGATILAPYHLVKSDMTGYQTRLTLPIGYEQIFVFT